MPYWFRFAQCLNKYREKPLKAHLRNAGKYFVSMCVPLASLWVVKFQMDAAFWIYVVVKLTATVYSYSWDLYMDWGIMRSRDPKKYGLRAKITFSKYFYYWAAVSNLALRFLWVVFIWRNLFVVMDYSGEQDLGNEFHLQLLVGLSAEMFRRT